MPNWCFNRVTCTGTSGDIANLIDYVQEDDNDFSFNAVMTMPPELREVTSPVKAFKTKAEVELYNAKHKNVEFGAGKAITHAKHRFLIKKYGHADWYNWSIENWGCKWDTHADGVDMSDNADNGCVSYRFDTPWGPPQGIYKKLHETFPEVDISWFYDEPGMEFSGYLPD